MKRTRKNSHRTDAVQMDGQLVPAEDRWTHNPGNELLIREVLSPLLEIIYCYKESQCYNYVPGTDTDCDAGWDHFENRFNGIYQALDQNLYISHETYLKALRIIREIQRFVRAFSCADGLPERYFIVNPNLRFYRCAFQLKEEVCDFAALNHMLAYVPSDKDVKEREAYFGKKSRLNEKYNFQHDEDDYFMRELAYTVRLVFLQDLEEFVECNDILKGIQAAWKRRFRYFRDSNATHIYL